MKLRHKSAATVISGFLAGISLGIWGALLLHHQIHHSGYEKIISNAVLAGVFLFGIILAGFAFAFRRSLFRTINDLGNFADQLGSGGVPDPMQLPDDADISRLYSLLNYLRDRQQTLTAKLADGIERESSLRKEIEFFNAILVEALKKLLNETEQNLSVVKGLLLCLLSPVELSSSQRRSCVLRALRRIGILNREIELGSDLLSLDRDRVMNRTVSEFSTSSLYQELSERITPAFASRKIILSGSYNASVPVCLRGDRELLSEVLLLMVRTIGRVTKTGGCVIFNVSGGGSKVVFEVAVERTSPVLEELAENYDKFKQAHTGSTLPDDCTLNVLGLEIIRKIAAYTDSPFTVESDERYSTRLLLVLDKGFANDSGRVPAFPSFKLHNDTQNPASQERHNLRILLADADEDECTALKWLMKHERIELATAANEKELLATLEELPFDGVILAPPFSNSSSPELIRTLRKRANWSRLPVVVIAPEISDDTLLEFKEMNRVQFLEMPLNYEQLAQLLHSRL